MFWAKLVQLIKDFLMAIGLGLGFGGAVASGSRTSPLEASVRLGAKTKAGAGGVSVLRFGSGSGFSITSGNGDGHLAISDAGEITNTASGDAAGMNGEPYSIDVESDNVSGSLVVNCPANMLHCKPIKAEIEAAWVAAVSGDTVEIRDGELTTGDRISLVAKTSATPILIVAENYVTNANRKNVTRPVLLPGLDVPSSTVVDGCIVKGIEFQRDWVSGEGVTNGVIQLALSTNFSILDCEIHSNPLATTTIKLNTEVLSGVVNGFSGTEAITIEDNWIHETARTLRISGLLTRQRNLCENTVTNFGTPFNPLPGTLIKDERCIGVWARGGGKGQTGPNNPGGDPDLYPYDEGDPHSSLISFAASSDFNNLTIEGCIFMVGTNRFDAKGDYEGFAGGFASDNIGSNTASNITIKSNLFMPNGGQGMLIHGFEDSEIAWNTIAFDTDTSVGTQPSANIGDKSGTYGVGGENVSLHHNIGLTWSRGAIGDGSMTVSHNNLSSRTGTDGPIAYSQLFDGPIFTGLTLADVEAAFTPVTSGLLDSESPKVGCFGTYYNFSTGVSSYPAWTKPITTVSTGVDLTSVTFDGAAEYMKSTSSAFGNFSTGDEITIVLGITLGTGADSDNSFIFDGHRLSLEKFSNGRCRLIFYSGSGNGNIFQFDTSLQMLEADGHTIWTFSVNIATGQAYAMKGTELDPMLSFFSFTGEGYGLDSTQWGTVMAARFNSAHFNGSLSFFWISPEFIDLNTVANLNKIVSLDGKHPSYGADGSTLSGTQPITYLTGTAGEWNDAGGLNLGSAGPPYIVTDGSVT